MKKLNPVGMNGLDIDTGYKEFIASIEPNKDAKTKAEATVLDALTPLIEIKIKEAVEDIGLIVHFDDEEINVNAYLFDSYDDEYLLDKRVSLHDLLLEDISNRVYIGGLLDRSDVTAYIDALQNMVDSLKKAADETGYKEGT